MAGKERPTNSSRSWRGWRTAVVLALTTWLSVVSGLPALIPTPIGIDNRVSSTQRTDDAATPTPSCATGRLVIGDLAVIEDAFEEGAASESAKALEWHGDARMVGLRVGCRLLENGFNWRGVFFSDAIQTYWYSDTGETRTVDAVAPPGPTLPLDGVSFVTLQRSLIRAGYSQTTQLNPSSNIEIRLNSDEAPFGPAAAPRGDVYFHVAIEARGDVLDLFVSADDGTIYRYPAA